MATDRLVADLDPALRQHLLDVAQAEGEAEIEPHGVADYVSREPVTLERAHSTDRGRSFHVMAGADSTRWWAVFGG